MTAWDGIFTVGIAGICFCIIGFIVVSIADPKPWNTTWWRQFLTGYLAGSVITTLTGLVGMIRT